MLDEGTAAAEAMTLMHRAVRGAVEPAGRRRRRVPPDRGRAGHPRRAARHRDRRPPTCGGGLPDGEFFGVIAQLPGASGAVTDWTALVAAGPRARRAGRRRRRPAGADADHAARRASVPTSRSAPPNVSVCQWDSAARTPATWPCTPSMRASCPAGWSACPSTRMGAGLSACAADPRAAHPPRQGHQQHLHRAGAAGGDRRDVRQLPRRRTA